MMVETCVKRFGRIERLPIKRFTAVVGPEWILRWLYVRTGEFGEFALPGLIVHDDVDNDLGSDTSGRGGRSPDEDLVEGVHPTVSVWPFQHVFGHVAYTMLGYCFGPIGFELGVNEL